MFQPTNSAATKVPDFFRHPGDLSASFPTRVPVQQHRPFSASAFLSWLDAKPAEVEIAVDGARKTLSGEALNRWKYQRHMQDYLGCIQSIDDNVGRLLEG